MNKTRLIFDALLGVGIGLLVLYFGYSITNSTNKKITKILLDDSIKTDIFNKKVITIDSITNNLKIKDSIQTIKYTKTKKNFERTEKNIDSYTDSIGYLPKL